MDYAVLLVCERIDCWLLFWRSGQLIAIENWRIDWVQSWFLKTNILIWSWPIDWGCFRCNCQCWILPWLSSTIVIIEIGGHNEHSKILGVNSHNSNFESIFWMTYRSPRLASYLNSREILALPSSIVETRHNIEVSSGTCWSTGVSCDQRWCIRICRECSKVKPSNRLH